MNCFNHQQVSAIGLCKSCNKGLCEECAVDLVHGLACKGKHEEQVEALNMIITKNAKIFSSASKNTLIAPVFYLFMGLVFAGFGYFSRGGVTDLPFVMGVGFIVFAIVIFIRNKQIFSKDTKQKDVRE